MAHPTSSPELRGGTLELRRGLAGLRRRIRGLFALTGVARVVVAVLLALGLFYAADLFLDLPLGVRRFVRLGLLDQPTWLPGWLWLPVTALAGVVAFYLVRGRRAGAPLAAFVFAGIAGLLAAIALRAFAPLTARLKDEELAAAVEARHGRLADRLESALDFERALASDAQGAGRGESRAMMQALLDQARVDARGLAFAQVASGRSTVAWLGSAALALLGAGAFFALSPAKAGLFARRGLLLEDVPWPRASTLYAARLGEDGSITPWPAELPFEVAVGRSLIVHAWAEGEPVDDAQLLDLAEGQQPLPRRMFPVAGRPGLYAVELVNVRQGFRFIVQGGDDRDETPVYSVAATVAPALIEVRADLVYPDYLGRAPERVEGGNLDVPQGTRVTLTLLPSEPLAQLRALLGDEVREAERTAVDGGGEAWRLAFEAERTLRYRLLLRTPKGRENDPGQDAYEITVRPDAAPRVAWTWPRGVTEVTPNGRVPLIFTSQDDHAVVQVVLDLRVGSEGPITEVRLAPHAPGAPPGVQGAAGAGGTTAAAHDGPEGRPAIASYLALDLASLAPDGKALAAPTTLYVRARATDSKGQAGESPWQTLEVSAPAEVERLLASRRSGVRSAVDGLDAEQAARLAQVKELRAGPLDAGERDLLKTIEFAQAKLAQHGERAVRDFLDIFAHFVLDRLGAENPNERILAMIDRAHRAGYGRAPAAPSGGAPGADDPVFPYALFAEIVATWRAGSILDTALLERMLVVLEVALEVATQVGPAAHQAATRAANGGPAELAALEAAQQAHLDALRRLTEGLASWESLNDVIVRLKRIVEEQKALLERLDAASDAPQDGTKKEGAPAPGGR